MALVTRYVNTASTPGGNGTTNAVSGANRAYASANEWEAAEQTDLVTDGNYHVVHCCGTSADTTQCYITGWNTASGNYIEMVGNLVGRVYNTSYYRLEVTDDECLRIAEDYVNIFHMQFKPIYSAATPEGIEVTALTAGNNLIQIAYCYIKGSNGDSGSIYGITSGASKHKIWNNIISDIGKFNDNNDAISILSADTSYIYDNTIYNTHDGIRRSNSCILKNNICQSVTRSYSGGTNANDTKNILDDSGRIDDNAHGVVADSGTTDGAAANKLIQSGQNFLTTVKVGMIVKNTTDTTYSYVTAVDSDTQLTLNNNIMADAEDYAIYTNSFGAVSFVNAAGGDFGLASNDTLAKDNWSNVYADANIAVTDDIEGNARPNDSTGDIGASEYAATKIPIFMHHYKQMGGA